jgi:hypothetical protein
MRARVNRMRILGIGLVAIVVGLAGPGFVRGAAAQAEEARCLDELTEAEVDARYQMIYRAVKAQEKDARWYYFTWMGIFAGLFTGNVLQAVYRVDGVLARHVVGAVGSGLSMSALTIFPRAGLRAAFGTRRLNRQPGGTPAERRQRLVYAERLLERSAGAQYLGAGIPAHGQGVIWGLTTGLLLGLRYDDLQGALVIGLGGVAMNELRIATQPKGSIIAWENYRNATKSCLAPRFRQDPRWSVAADGGLGIRLEWF